MNTQFIDDLLEVAFDLDGYTNRLGSETIELRNRMRRIMRHKLPNELPIIGRFEWERGRFVDGEGYIDRTYTHEIRLLKMVIERSKQYRGEWIVRFVGGPTGYESYFVNSLIRFPLDGDDFCICAGTINSWPKCTVFNKEVQLFVRSYRG